MPLNTRVATPEVLASLRAFLDAFTERYYMQPPEFSDVHAMMDPRSGWEEYFGGLYRDPVRGHQNPLDSDWYRRLLTEATTGDMEAIERTCSSCRHYMRYFQRALLREARRRDEAGMDVSPYIPVTFRAKGWGGLTEPWNCERRQAPAPLALPVPSPYATPPGSPRAAAPLALGPSTGATLPVPSPHATPPGSPTAAAPAERVGDAAADLLSAEHEILRISRELQVAIERYRQAREILGGGGPRTPPRLVRSVSPPGAPRPAARHSAYIGLSDYGCMRVGMLLNLNPETDEYDAAAAVRAEAPTDPSDLPFDELAAGARRALGWSREHVLQWLHTHGT